MGDREPLAFATGRAAPAADGRAPDGSEIRFLPGVGRRERGAPHAAAGARVKDHWET